MIRAAETLNSRTFGNCWININRECNIRCTWCYAKPVGYSKAKRAKVDDYTRVLDVIAELGISHITLLGGEPTVNPDLPDIVRLAAARNLGITLVSNGIALADEGYLDSLLAAGVTAIDISLKGASEDEYLANTRFKRFNTVVAAIHNVSSRDVQFSVSAVLSPLSIHTIAKGLSAARDAGAHFFSLSFCYDFSGLEAPHSSTESRSTVASDIQLIADFESSYPEICVATENQFSLMQSYPLCLWSPGIIQEMLSKGQINSICQLLDQSGLVLDTDFTVIPCNAMSSIRLGTFGVDWTDAKSFLERSQRPEARETMDLLSSAPSATCAECELWPVCGGGCVSFWVNNTFEEIEDYRQTWGLAALGLPATP